MQVHDRRLWREIVLILAIKVLLLIVLWGACVRGQRLDVAPEDMARRAGLSLLPATADRGGDHGR